MKILCFDEKKTITNLEPLNSETFANETEQKCNILGVFKFKFPQNSKR